MANLITHSLTFNKESVNEYFIKPLFVENDIRSLVDIRLDIKSGEKLDFVDNLEKITKAYAQGTSFVTSTGVTITQKTLTVADMKAEVKQNGKAFLNYVKQAALKKGYSENDISDTLFEEIVMAIFMDGLKADLQRQLWFGQTNKENRTSNVLNGVPNPDYNVYKGFFDRLYTDAVAGTIPSAQVLDLNTTTYVTTAAVKQKATTTLTGTGGTANITVNGIAYLATFDTSLTQTAANFVTDHAAAIAARDGGIVVTSSGADVIFESGVAGEAINISNAVNASGNLACTTAATTANVKMSALKAGAALEIFKQMYSKMPAVLRKNKNLAKIMVTASIADNFRDSMESATAGADSSYNAVIDVVRKLAYRGIEIVEMLDWDNRINEDFGDVRPHRAVLTIPKNLVVGHDGSNDDTNIEFFYDQTTQNNHVRVEYKVGTQYIHPDYIVLAF